MYYSWGYSYYKPVPTIEEKKIKMLKFLKAQEKKGIKYNGIPEKTKLGTTWWGKAWKEKIKSYADEDYSNRIMRGATYVRNGFVIHIDIKQNEVNALVFGTRSKPYTVVVNFNELSTKKINEISEICSQRVDSLEQLIEGKFPEDLKDVFIKDLFPAQNEIHFKCTCPDYAALCKHVAAVLYSIGIVFDKDPKLFFTLRGIDINKFIKQSVDKKSEEILKENKEKSEREIDKDDAKNLFGID